MLRQINRGSLNLMSFALEMYTCGLVMLCCVNLHVKHALTKPQLLIGTLCLLGVSLCLLAPLCMKKKGGSGNCLLRYTRNVTFTVACYGGMVLAAGPSRTAALTDAVLVCVALTIGMSMVFFTAATIAHFLCDEEVKVVDVEEGIPLLGTYQPLTALGRGDREVEKEALLGGFIKSSV